MQNAKSALSAIADAATVVLTIAIILVVAAVPAAVVSIIPPARAIVIAQWLGVDTRLLTFVVTEVTISGLTFAKLLREYADRC